LAQNPMFLTNSVSWHIIYFWGFDCEAQSRPFWLVWVGSCLVRRSRRVFFPALASGPGAHHEQPYDRSSGRQAALACLWRGRSGPSRGLIPVKLLPKHHQTGSRWNDPCPRQPVSGLPDAEIRVARNLSDPCPKNEVPKLRTFLEWQ
jgi:hypothetical protein